MTMSNLEERGQVRHDRKPEDSDEPSRPIMTSTRLAKEHREWSKIMGMMIVLLTIATLGILSL